FGDCGVLESNLVDFRATLYNSRVRLNWRVLENQFVKYFDIERSFDGSNFTVLARMQALPSQTGAASYSYDDDVSYLANENIYYRIRMKDISNEDKLSNIIGIPLSGTGKNSIYVYPNPVKDNMQVQILSVADG